MSIETFAEKPAESHLDTVTFFEQHKDSLRRLFVALGREALWSQLGRSSPLYASEMAW